MDRMKQYKSGNKVNSISHWAEVFGNLSVPICRPVSSQYAGSSLSTGSPGPLLRIHSAIFAPSWSVVNWQDVCFLICKISSSLPITILLGIASSTIVISNLILSAFSKRFIMSVVMLYFGFRSILKTVCCVTERRRARSLRDNPRALLSPSISFPKSIMGTKISIVEPSVKKDSFILGVLNVCR